MYEKSESITLSQSTSYAADSPAKTSVSPENEKASPEADPACGQSTRASFASFDPDSSLWKTSQRCVFGGWEPFSETWPRAGMMLSGTAYRLPPSAPLTCATGSSSSLGPNGEGLWPTPTVKGNYKKSTYSGKSGDGLSTAVKKWPTPTARDWKDTGDPKKLAQYEHKKRLGCSVAASNPQGHGSLNPAWVEWLMGYEIGHSDCDASVTP